MRENGRLLERVSRVQDELRHRATHDALTDLANRDLFEQAARDGLAGPGLSLALIDLDDFKAINDRLGHVAGDALLIAVGDRLRGCVRHADTVARLGGDEFGLLLPDLSGRDATDVLDRIGEALARPVAVHGHDLLVRASIGLAEGRDGDDAEELLRRADVAMYEAKSLGKGRVVRFDAAMDQCRAELTRMAADLRAALGTEQLHLLYQPIVSLPGGELYAVEALARWNHPERGPISPAEFIVAAERTGLIVPLGAWILEQACRQAAAWRRELGDAAPRTVTVNVSARQLRETGFADEVGAVLRRTGLPAEVLTVEVTETAVFDSSSAIDTLRAVKALGVQIALDDFGTGHSSLGLLQAAPVDVLKVDKSFVDNITLRGRHATIATALINVSNELQLTAVAEGVETAEQADELSRLGYRYAQGYLFGRPTEAPSLFAVPVLVA
jgi:diguanylate cyclase (GGDEF)-like protein